MLAVWLLSLLLTASAALAQTAGLVILEPEGTAEDAPCTFRITPPTTNEDGTPLTDLFGYRFYMSMTSKGHVKGQYTAQVPLTSLSDPSKPTVQLACKVGEYWVNTAYDNKTPANESGFSNEVQVQAGEPPAAPFLACIDPTPAPPDGNRLPLLPIVAITASASQVDHGPNYSVDGAMETWWAAHGTYHWLQADLGAIETIKGVRVAWYAALTQRTNFAVQVSTDGTKWAEQTKGTSSGTTADFEFYGFPAVQARYVRLTCTGTNVNKWNSVAEWQIVGN